MDKHILITDLDNTLYDWVTFYTEAFRAMVAVLQRLTSTDEETLLHEFKHIHETFGNTEQPFAALELPSVKRAFHTSDHHRLMRELDPAFHEFNKVRKSLLTPYYGVREQLSALQTSGVTIVGHTEAIAANAAWRLQKLGLLNYFARLYTLEGRSVRRETTTYPPWQIEDDFLRELPRAERKPNPALLVDICSREGFAPSEAVYVGDSLTRDISMAKTAGVTAVWAKYGLQYDRKLWSYLVSVSHWTKDDVKREEALKAQYAAVEPDVTIDNFGDLGALFKPKDKAGRARINAM